MIANNMELSEFEVLSVHWGGGGRNSCSRRDDMPLRNPPILHEERYWPPKIPKRLQMTPLIYFDRRFGANCS